jgi:hypothetical protein
MSGSLLLAFSGNQCLRYFYSFDQEPDIGLPKDYPGTGYLLYSSYVGVQVFSQVQDPKEI